MDTEELTPPKEGKKDLANKILRAALSQIPILSGVNEFLKSPFAKRKELWNKKIREGLIELNSKLNICLEKLGEHDKFIDLLIETSQAAFKTSSEEKLGYLRNFLLNAANEPNQLEDLDYVLLKKIDACTPSHIKVLVQVSKSRPPHLGYFKTGDDPNDPFLQDCKYMNLIRKQNSTESRRYGRSLDRRGNNILVLSDLGRRLINKIKDPIHQ